MLLWAAIALVIVTRFAWRHFVLVRMLNRCRDCSASTARSALDAAAEHLGVSLPIRLLESTETISPLTAGTFRPVIVLPIDAQDWPAEKTSAVLLHELAHIKRRDVLTQLLASLACALHWFNPLAWHSLAQLRRLRELACDDLVLTSGQRASDYAAVLLEVARRYRHPQFAGAVNMARQANVEHRITALLDAARNRVPLSRRAARGLAVAMVMVVAGLGTMRVESRAEEKTANKTDQAAIPQPRTDIRWTAVPKIDDRNPTRHRGVVLASDGKPVAGARIYAASTIELFEMQTAACHRQNELGPVRAVTDAQGRFDFDVPDLSHETIAGVRKRWETLLVATKEGLAPGWLRTFGDDRSLRDHWHPWRDREVAIRMQPLETLTGRLVSTEGSPLSGAKISITGLMAPVYYDLERHIREEVGVNHGMFGTPDYAEQLYRPQLIPGLSTQTTTTENGQFSLVGLPRNYIAQLSVSHPQVVTSQLQVAISPTKPFFYKKPTGGRGEPILAILGSEFTIALTAGVTLRGRVEVDSPNDSEAASGVTVALANHNSPDEMSGERFTTDANGRFQVTGLWPSKKEYTLAFAGSYAAPYRGAYQLANAEEDCVVKLAPAARYRLKLTDAAGRPLSRQVYSIDVQSTPGTVQRAMKDHFNFAQQVAPGVYEGIVPLGPGAVLVKRGAKSDRPVAVEPKQFFATNKRDWTLAEQRFAYGDTWRIARPAHDDSSDLAVWRNPTIDQTDLAAVVFTNASTPDEVLELDAKIESDPPVQVSLVDQLDNPVTGAMLDRQLSRYQYEERKLPATFSLYGLHPQRAEFLQFTHSEHGLIGTLSTTWQSEPIKVVMQTAATLIGRLVDRSGQPDRDFSIRVTGEFIAPDTFVGSRVYATSEKPSERPGEFRLSVPPGSEVRGEYITKNAELATQPKLGVAFGPIAPKPGETIQLGDLVMPE